MTLVAGLPALPAAAATAGAVVDAAGCTANVLERNDDGSTGALQLPFALNFYGTSYQQVFVNNNGNVTFDAALWEYTPFGLSATSRAIIAPFFADVDTRNLDSGVVTYGTGSWDGRRAFCVSWPTVGYYPQAVDKTNTFQLLLVDRGDRAAGDFDVVFNYDQVQWETGGASGGSGGVGGNSARVGFSSGAGTADTSYELPGSGVNGAFLDGNLETGLVHNRRGASVNGRYVFSIRSGTPNHITRRPEELFGNRKSSFYVSDPVNTGTGNLTETYTDLPLAESVHGMDLGRTYNSRGTRSGVFGRGWSSALDVRIDEVDGGSVELTDFDGRIVPFVPRADGSGWERPEEFAGDLVREADGTYAVQFHNGDRWSFRADGWRLSTRDWTGQSVTVERDASGRPVAITSSTGLRLTPSVDASGRLTQVTSSDGRSVTYGYSGDFLSSVTDAAGGVMRYDPDAAGRLLRVTDAAGRLVAENDYDAEGRVVVQRTATNAMTFEYRDLDGTTVVTDQSTHEPLLVSHDRDGRVLAVQDAAGFAVTHRYDSAGNVVAITDRRAHTLTQQFDTRGNLLSITDRSGNTERFNHDELDRLTSRTEPNGARWSFTYQDSDRIPSRIVAPDDAVTTIDVQGGLVRSVVDPDGVGEWYEYDQLGNVRTVTDAVGGRVEYTYHATGDVLTERTAEGRTTVSTFDPLGRLLSETDPTGAKTSYTYDPAGELASTTDPVGGKETYVRDGAGRITRTTDALGGVTERAYNAGGNLLSEVAPGGATTRHEYGVLGRLVKTTDPVGNVTSYAYDATGLVTSVTDPSGKVERTEYDREGRVVADTDGAGTTTRYEYDHAGRVTAEVNPLGERTTYTYDAYGSVVTTTDATGASEKRQYTPGQRLAQIRDAVGGVTRYEYDSAGRLAQIVDPAGGATRRTYDGDGLLTSETTPEGRTTRFSHDGAGRVTREIAPDGGITTRSFDPRGLLASVTEPDGAVTKAQYDVLGRVQRAIDPLGGITAYSYDGRGNRTSRKNAADKTESWNYDLNDRLASYADQLGNTTTYDWDHAGRPKKIVDPTGRVETRQYDGAGKTTGRLFGDGTAVAYGYDLAGRLISMTDAAGTTSYTLDAAGHTTSVTYPDGRQRRYELDALGRQTAVVEPDGTRTQRTWSTNGDLAGVHSASWGTAQYERDRDGLVTAETLPTGSRHYTLDLAGRQIGMQQTVDNKATVTALTRDAVGRVTRSLTADDVSGDVSSIYAAAMAAVQEPVSGVADALRGAVLREYQYDQAGQLTQTNTSALLEHAGAQAESYAYDAVGNRTHKTRGTDRTSYAHDPANRLISGERLNSAGEQLGRASWTYDAAGRRVAEESSTSAVPGTGDLVNACWWNDWQQECPADSVVDAALNLGVASSTRSAKYAYNAAGRLASVDSTLPDGTKRSEQRTYDAHGDLTGLVATDANGQRATNLTWDTSDDTSVLTSMKHNGKLLSLIQGDERTLGVARDNGTTGVFATDALGSLVATDGTADAVTAKAYDAFGNPAFQGAPNPLPTIGFKGELHIDRLIHLRARDYDPTVGVFTTPDPLDGGDGRVTVANRYPYADNDPVNLTDPLGLSPVGDRELRQFARTPAVAGAAAVAANVAACVSCVVKWVSKKISGKKPKKATTVVDLLPAGVSNKRLSELMAWGHGAPGAARGYDLVRKGMGPSIRALRNEGFKKRHVRDLASFYGDAWLNNTAKTQFLHRHLILLDVLKRW